MRLGVKGLKCTLYLIQEELWEFQIQTFQPVVQDNNELGIRNATRKCTT